MKETCRVSFQPDGRTVFVIRGTNLIEAAGQGGIIIDTPCGGKAGCGKCKIQIQRDAPEPNASDIKHLSTEEYLSSGCRLACQCKVLKDMVVYIPDSVRFFEQIVLTSGHEREYQVEPNIRKCHLAVPEPTVNDLRSDEDRLDGQDPVAGDPVCDNA